MRTRKCPAPRSKSDLEPQPIARHHLPPELRVVYAA
jgi:hypothetical protein